MGTPVGMRQSALELAIPKSVIGVGLYSRKFNSLRRQNCLLLHSSLLSGNDHVAF